MSRLSDLLNVFSGGGSVRSEDDIPSSPSRADQRQRRMADAAVSLADIRADAAEMHGSPMEAHGPIHPGEILWEEFMQPLGVKAPTTAKALGVPRTRIERLVAGQTALSPDTAVRLARAFTTTTPLFWMNLQSAYDVEMAEQEMAKVLASIRPFKSVRMAAAGA